MCETAIVWVINSVPLRISNLVLKNNRKNHNSLKNSSEGMHCGLMRGHVEEESESDSLDQLQRVPSGAVGT